MSRAFVAILAFALLAACASPARGDWSYSEVASAVEGYRRQHPATPAELPQRIRTIRIDGAERLTVYLSDSPGLSGLGCELRLARTPAGAWIVTGSRFFTY
jgi:hypothetical protein